MKAITWTVAGVSAIYLICGIPDELRFLSSEGIIRIVACLHVACILLGVSGCVAAFLGHRRTARWTMLPALGVASLIYHTHAGLFAFPALVHLPVTFGSAYSPREFYHFGVDLIPAALFLCLWFTLRVPGEGGKASKPLS